MNSCTIAGRIGKDASVSTVNDKTVCNFSVAVDDGYGENKKTLWFDCALWGQRGEKLSQYLAKGTPVTVTGRVGTRAYEGKAYLTLFVLDLTMQGGKRDESQGGAPAGGYDDGSEIPFAPEWRV